MLDQFVKRIVSDQRRLQASVYFEIGTLLTNHLKTGGQNPLPETVICQSEALFCDEFAGTCSTTNFESCARFLQRIFKKGIYLENSIGPFARDFIKAVATQMEEEATTQIYHERPGQRRRDNALGKKAEVAQGLYNDVSSAIEECEGNQLGKMLCEIIFRLHRDYTSEMSDGPRAVFVNFLRQTFGLAETTKMIQARTKHQDSTAALANSELDQGIHALISATSPLSKAGLVRESYMKADDPISARPPAHGIHLNQSTKRRIAETYKELAELTSCLKWNGLSENDPSKGKCLKLVTLLVSTQVDGLAIDPELFRNLNEREGLFVDEVAPAPPALERPPFYDGKF